MRGEKIGKAADGLAYVLEAAVTFLFFVILIMVILLVLLRYFFNTSIVGGHELNGMLFIYTTSVGAAAVVGRRNHITIDFLVSKFKGPLWIASDILVQILVAGINTVLFFLSLGWIGKVGSFLSPVLRIPNKFIQMAIPIGTGLAVLFCMLNIIRNLTGETAKRRKENASSDS